jgi:hypothetical protein
VSNLVAGTGASRATGYRLLAEDGGIFAFGAAPAVVESGLGSNHRWVAMSTWCDGVGLVAVSADGRLRGVDHDLGDPAGSALPESAAPAIDVEGVGRREGCWVLDAAGGVFSVGDAGFHGSIPGLGDSVHTAPIVAMASTSSGSGYWILDAAGGVYAFGDAEFYGSTPALRLETPPAPAVDIVASPTGEGYAVLEGDGTIRGFGDLSELIEVEDGITFAAVAFAPTPTPNSYVVVDGRGFVYPAGMAPMFGSLAHLVLRGPVVDVVVHSELDPSAS